MPNRLFCGCCNACDKRTHTFASDGSGLANWHLIDADAGAITAAQTNGEIREGVIVLSKAGLLPNANRYVYDLALDGRERLSFPLKMRLISQASVTESETYGYGLGDHVFGEVEILNSTNDMDDFEWTFRLSIGKVVSGVETVLDTTFWPATKTNGDTGISFTSSYDIVLRLCRATVDGYDGATEVLSFKVGYILDNQYSNYDAQVIFPTQPDHSVIGDAASETPTGLHVGYQLITDSETQDEPRVKQSITQRSQTDELTTCLECTRDTFPCPCDLETEKVVWSDASFNYLSGGISGMSYVSGPTDLFSTRWGGYPGATGSPAGDIGQPYRLCRTLHARFWQYSLGYTNNLGQARTQYYVIVEWCDIMVGVSFIDRVVVTTRGGVFVSANRVNPPFAAYDLDQYLIDIGLDPNSNSTFTRPFTDDPLVDPLSDRGVAISGFNTMTIDRSLWDCGNFSIDIELEYAGAVPHPNGGAVSGAADSLLTRTATISNL